MWRLSVERAEKQGLELPEFDEFWQAKSYRLPEVASRPVWLAGFRADPQTNRLQTPSGKIEIFSATIAGFEYEDCPGHPTWLEPFERLGGL